MITKEDIEKPRSPRGLRQFVCYRKKKVQAIRSERHAAILRKGIYNYFIKELVPLSIFALKAYPNSYRVEPKLGNQGYDAIVRDSLGKVIDYVELTFPDDWHAKAKDAEHIVSQGVGKCDVYSPGEDIDRLCKFIYDVCLNKAKKDYSDCSLVIVIDFVPPETEFHRLYSRKIGQVLNQVRSISFKTKRVFLLLLEQHEIVEVC